MLAMDDMAQDEEVRHRRFSLGGDEEEPSNRDSLPMEASPFEKWLKTIHRRAAHRKTISCDSPRMVGEMSLYDNHPTQNRQGHRKSISGSSFGFVTNMKSVGTSLASISIAPRSRTGVSSRQQRTDFSSKASYAGRASEDNINIARGIVIDQAVAKRSERRQNIIGEILATEKDYLDDIQALIRVFDGFLVTVPILSRSLRKSIVLTLKDIWSLNNDLYRDIASIVSKCQKYTTPDPSGKPMVKGHKRWQSLGGIPSDLNQQRHLGDPKVAGDIAKIFGSKVHRLFVYEPYGIMFAEVLSQVNTTYRTTEEWKDLNLAIQSTEELIASIDERASGTRKSRSFMDYFIKPVQRIAKYEVLFGRLLEESPVCDCPESSMRVENTLFRIIEAHKAMDATAGNHKLGATMARTWLLQDRLVFADQPESRSQDKIRTLDQILLCGVLHASWQTKESAVGQNVTGQYLIALLYQKFFVLASGKQDQVYAIQACIPTCELKVEEVDNGKGERYFLDYYYLRYVLTILTGLQCHTAPYSWKIVFEHHCQLFEITMSACSAKEEIEWKSRLIERSEKEGGSTVVQAMLTSLSLNIKPMGMVYGRPGTIARRNSIHRATTIAGQTTVLGHVIIKNTSTTTDPLHFPSQASINRSQSLQATHRPTVLAPSRTERIRLETLLSDVWTRDILPYPGMSSRPRNEHPVRASASSMMRKLSSHASISSITKRSSSMASLHKSSAAAVAGAGQGGEDQFVTELDILKPSSLSTCTGKLRHNSSETMLVAEFEGQGSAGLRLTVIMDEKESALSEGAVGSVGRFASFRSKRSWGQDSGRSRAPSRSLSGSSVIKSVVSLVVVGTGEMVGLVGVGVGEEKEKENLPQAEGVDTDAGLGGGQKKGKLEGRNRGLLIEGFRNFFR
ncbi:Round spore protein [Rutstroemia sp. NJR-2017a BVV2]|nr:Round spore protein [Rutstroemia sp. NJR-2017a BVV2]PQE18466.1 Round spore protein [Rutstroemia sp. NJR-2017a BVV2]